MYISRAAYRDEAGAGDGELGDDPPPGVARPDGHAVTATQPQPQEPRGQLVGLCARAGERDRTTT